MHQIAGYLQNYAWGIPGGLAHGAAVPMRLPLRARTCSQRRNSGTEPT